MLDDRLRGYKDRALTPLAMLARGVSPNAISLSALLVGLAAAWGAALGLPIIAVILWLLNRVLDGIDGIVARHIGRQKDFGGYLDILTDFAVYAAVPIGLYLGQPSFGLSVSLAVLLETRPDTSWP